MGTVSENPDRGLPVVNPTDIPYSISSVSVVDDVDWFPEVEPKYLPDVLLSPDYGNEFKSKLHEYSPNATGNHNPE